MYTVQVNDRQGTTYLVVRGEWIHFTSLIKELSPDTITALLDTITLRMDVCAAIAHYNPIEGYKDAALLELDHLAALHTALKNA